MTDTPAPPPGSPTYRPNRPQTGAPNVVMFVLDDTGFAQLGSFGASLEQAEKMAKAVPDSTFHIRPGKSHLGGFAAATGAIEIVLGHWPDRTERRMVP